MDLRNRLEKEISEIESEINKLDGQVSSLTYMQELICTKP